MLFNSQCSNVSWKTGCGMEKDKNVIGLVGMPGSGKSLVVEAAMQVGYAVVVMGDIVRKETQKRGLKLTPKNVGQVMLELRELWGNGVIAEKCVSEIERVKSENVIVDGLRSLYEVDVFKATFTKFTLIAIHASPETRFKRLYNRGRSDDSTELKVFRERDQRELTVGLGNVIAMAEYVIVNEGSREETNAKIEEVLSRVEEKWTK
jgi:dephospho-CoA kinase